MGRTKVWSIRRQMKVKFKKKKEKKRGVPLNRFTELLKREKSYE